MKSKFLGEFGDLPPHQKYAELDLRGKLEALATKPKGNKAYVTPQFCLARHGSTRGQLQHDARATMMCD